MANLQLGANEEKKIRRRQRSHNELNVKKSSKSSGGAVTLDPDVSEVRRIRLERLNSSPIASAATPTMTSESHATLPSLKSSQRRKRDQHRSPDETKHRRRRKSAVKGEGATVYVYGNPATRTRAPPARKSGSDADSSSSDEDAVKVRPKERKIRVINITEEEEQAKRRRERRTRTRESKELPQASRESIRRNRTHHTRRKSIAEVPLRRSSTAKEVPSVRPTVKRSNTTSTKVSEVKTTTSTNTAAKRSSFMGSLFSSAPKQPIEPERLIECLTCLSDDIPRSKSAKLKCGHRMCHSCLRRIFRLSINDPQHMPPKCCTTDHIPLRHVDKLFNIEFKKNWNRKFQEFSTKNRIYCPGKRCGEWIKPSNIHKEEGRKFGKCSRCKTKVCCLCNGKWHGTKDCPKDEETNRLLDAAKEAGWQRCYSCRTMVELKEGCNHMTCHCTAEFCMCCGLKWKTCNCPWFNYDAVEEDRLNHMQIPEEPIPDRPNRLRRPRPPNNYHEEIDERRRQERADEELARRLQRAGVSDDDDDYQGGIGNINGVGNGAGHLMNQNYVRAAHILTGRYDQAAAAANYVMGVRQARGGPRPEAGPRRMSGRYPAPVPPPNPLPPMRRNSVREHLHPGIPPMERVIPVRRRNEHENDVPFRTPPENARLAILAGLGGRGGNRVDAWRSFVQVGAPEEGVLSI